MMNFPMNEVSVCVLLHFSCNLPCSGNVREICASSSILGWGICLNDCSRIICACICFIESQKQKIDNENIIDEAFKLKSNLVTVLSFIAMLDTISKLYRKKRFQFTLKYFTVSFQIQRRL